MKTILFVSCDPSSSLAKPTLDRLLAAHPGATVRVRDLVRCRPATSERLVAELFAADHVVVAAGPLDAGIPPSLEDWLDLVTVPGATFRSGAGGLVGLLGGRRATLVLGYAGTYLGGVSNGLAFERSFLRAALTLIGLDPVEAVVVEGRSPVECGDSSPLWSGASAPWCTHAPETMGA